MNKLTLTVLAAGLLGAALLATDSRGQTPREERPVRKPDQAIPSYRPSFEPDRRTPLRPPWA